MFKSKDKWSLVPESEFSVNVWEHEIVLFNQLTQDTHLLAKPVDWILEKLKYASLTLDELTESAIRENLFPNDSDCSLAMINFVNSLLQIDVVEVQSNE
ncbi:MAG: hypothetical protein KGZ88_01420 [Methylomicrobium sp.]|nr:hypothetical protein [Methylomicrobium sp.]